MEVQEASPARSPRAAVLSILRSKCIKHFDFVHEYLALLAWNRCITHPRLPLQGGKCTVRTTIDTLMNRGFSRLHLVWVWIYVVIITSRGRGGAMERQGGHQSGERRTPERRFAQGTNANVSSSQASFTTPPPPRPPRTEASSDTTCTRRSPPRSPTCACGLGRSRRWAPSRTTRSGRMRCQSWPSP